MSAITTGRPGLRTNRAKIVPTVILLIGALYCMIPVAWVFIAATKAPGELFTSFSFSPGSGLIANFKALFSYEGGRTSRYRTLR